MSTTFIATVYNEESSIEKLLDSLKKQTMWPNEIIFVDGGSTDTTVEKLKKYILFFKDKGVSMHILIRPGNRSIGRNEAIRQAHGEVILCSDAGCVLDEAWVEHMSKPFETMRVDVVAGYYQGLHDTIFQKSLIPYVLIMNDRVDPENFLPASRSMAIRKDVWKKAGGFPSQFSHNEDYVFAKKLKKMRVKVFFQKDAIVYWLPRKNIIDAYVMFFRFAYGDAEARIYRAKVLLIFFRYFILGILITSYSMTRSEFILLIIIALGVLYCGWAVKKNYKYVQKYQAIVILPLLQLVSDVAVMTGTILGSLRNIWAIQEMQ